MKMKLTALVMVVSLSACSTQTALVNGRDGVLAKEEMQTFFVAGLGQTQSLNAAEICGGAAKVAKVERTTSFLNSVLNSLSNSIYAPQTAKVFCSQ